MREGILRHSLRRHGEHSLVSHVRHTLYVHSRRAPGNDGSTFQRPVKPARCQPERLDTGCAFHLDEQKTKEASREW